MSRFLGVDYGRRRIGFAVSDPGGTIAMPAGFAKVKSPEEAIKATRDKYEEKEATTVVVGIPYNMDGSAGEMAQEASAFAEGLASGGISIKKWDERLSSREAKILLSGSGLSRRKKKEKTDSVAAQIVLQSYLDSNPQK